MSGQQATLKPSRYREHFKNSSPYHAIPGKISENPIRELIYAMLAKGYTDGQLAKKIGINLSNFNRIKNGKNIPSVITFSRICVEFNLGKNQIFEIVSHLSEMHRTRIIVKRGNQP